MTTLVAWNLNHWQRSESGQREATWDYLRNTLAADVALVTEAGPPTHFEPAAVVRTWVDKDTGRDWGTAIVDITGNNLRAVTTVRAPDRSGPKPLTWSTPWAASATIDHAEGAVTLACLYGKFINQRAYSSLLRQLADLADLFEDAQLSERLLVAGDLNLTNQWTGRDAEYNRLEQTMLDLFAGWWLRDLIGESDIASSGRHECGCAAAPFCRHVQTFWSRTTRGPRQNDYAFGSGRLPVTSVRVDRAAVVDRELSDHAPVVITLAD